jgi:ATP-dependent helicase Lhr and Lhr-like helicase
MNACGGTPTKRTSALSLAGQGLAASAMVSRGCAHSAPVPGRASVGRPRGGRRRWPPRGPLVTGMPRASAAFPGAETGAGAGVDIEGGAELAARVLLDRYGVVFRRLGTREPWLPPWRELIAVYRRREARGELRGGRFVALASGEQFALPETVGLLREVRHRATSLELVSLSGADPLNLAGISPPGRRCPGDRVASSIWMAPGARYT